MRIFQKRWRQFRDWLKSFSQNYGTAGSAIDEASSDSFVEALDSERNLRHTIRVNLAILDKELTELNRIANRAKPSTAVTEARALLESAGNAALLDAGMFALSNKTDVELGETLSQVFAALRKSTQARRLLNACVSE